MDEDIAIINSNTRNEKVKNFLINNKKLLISFLVFIIFLLISFFIIGEFKERNKIKISNQYNLVVAEYSKKNSELTKNALIDLINKKDSTYSPLSLYFIIDNKLLLDQSKINELFDVVIKEVSLDTEIKNLIIYKKGLFNSDFETENNLIKILKPLINSDSVWKSHALYLMAEYFFDKNQKQKAKEFYNQILSYEKSNENIVKETQKRLSRDFSE